MINTIDLYRLSNKLYKNKLTILAKIIKNINFYIFNSVIPYTSEIGSGSKCAYGGIGVVIHSKAKIGENVLIGQNVTIGSKSKMEPGAPKIGNNVYISAGARVLGNITIGDNVIIGSNSVVLNDIPENSVVAGIPAKVIKQNINVKEYTSFWDN